jgi:hypothetical protein
MSIQNTEAHVDPKDIAEQLLGTIRWENNESKGYCTCPGQHRHNSRTGDRDCIVYLDGAATIYCMHTSCLEDVQEGNLALRRAIAEGHCADGGKKLSAQELRHKQREQKRSLQLERRARTSLAKLLKDYNWPFEKIKCDSPSIPRADVATQWHDVVGLFKPSDVIWIGDKWDSGSSIHQQNFKTAEQWLQTDKILGPLTCPSVFKSTSISRNNGNVVKRRFLVVESDVHSKDEVGAIFQWLKDAVGLSLRAIVDTGGKSLHGWFEYPKQAIVDQLQAILPQLGCDAGLFKASQPCRIPGALRGEKYQTLIYLDKSPNRRTAKLPSQVLPLPDVYYSGHNQSYWRLAAHGGWQKINEKSFDIELKAGGFSFEEDLGELLAEGVEAKRQIQIKHDVAYVGRLAGYSAGCYTIFGRPILVTESPNIVKPVPGQWDTIRQLVAGLLKDESVDQTPYFYGWVQTAYLSLTSGNFTPGQALAIAGVKDSGKSRLQNLITEMLGGRVAKPYHFMTGKSNFNSEMFSAEHLMIEDEPASTRIEARRNLGAMIKTVTVNVTQTCYGKGVEGITLKPFWRMSVTMNDEPEDLMVLPPFDEGIEDKIILLKAFRKEMPMPTDSPQEKTAFAKQLISEVPAFLSFLQTWEIPSNLVSNRFGIKTYHHPELLEKVTELAPEYRLLSLIDACQGLFPFTKNDWKGTALDLERELTDSEWSLHHQAKNLLQHQNTAGTLLGRLACQQPERVIIDRKSNGHAIWKIMKGEIK